MNTWEIPFKENADNQRSKYSLTYDEVRQCIVCHNDYRVKVANQKICSDKCREISKTVEFILDNDLKACWLKLRFEIFKRDNFTCQYCGRSVKEDKIKLHCDHIIPKNKGGKDLPENLLTSCLDCNLGKSDVLLDNKEYLR